MATADGDQGSSPHDDRPPSRSRSTSGWRTVTIFAAGPVDGDAPPPAAGLTLVRPGDPLPGELVAQAMGEAGVTEPAEARLHRGDRLWAYRVDGGPVVSFCWVTAAPPTPPSGRGPRLSEGPGRVFLLEFHTRASWRRRGLSSSLLRAARTARGAGDESDDGPREWIAAPAHLDEASRRTLMRADFRPAARAGAFFFRSRPLLAPWRSAHELPDAPARGLFEGWALVERPASPRMASSRSPVSIAADPALAVEVIEDAHRWDAVAGEWRELFASSDNAAPPLSWEWLRGWWRRYGEHYAAGPRALRVCLVRRGDRLVGALPLYLRRPRVAGSPARELAFVSSGEAQSEETCADYLDLLHRPGEGSACATALLAMLFEERRVPFERLVFDPVSERSPLLAWPARVPAGYSVFRSDRGTCPMADLDGGLEAWLARLPSRKRTQPRRLARQAHEAGAVLELARSPAEIDHFFDQLVELHQARWTADGKPGALASERFRDFHRELARTLVPEGRAVLARMSLEGRPLAVLYGFVERGKFDFYQAGVVLHEALHSPGITAHVLLMDRLAAEQGVATYDFLFGASSYKLRLATREVAMIGLRFERDGIRHATASALESVGSLPGRVASHARALLVRSR